MPSDYYFVPGVLPNSQILDFISAREKERRRRRSFSQNNMILIFKNSNRR